MGSGLRHRFPSGVVLKYYLFMATTGAGFTTPIWILFVRAQGLSWAQIGLLDSVWWLGLVAGEVPTGYLGDRVGRRNSMLASSVIVAVSTVAMGLSTTFLALASVYVLWAVGQTFRTGSDDAWLYDILQEQDATSLFSRIRGRGQATMLGVAALTAPMGGYLADFDLSFPFFAASVVTAMGAVVMLTVPEADGHRDGETFRVRQAVAVIRDRLAAPPLRSFVGYYALIYAVVGMVYIFDQPISKAIGLELGVPPDRIGFMLGWLYAGFTAVGAVASYHTDWIRERVGIRGWFAALPFVVGGLYLALGAVAFVAIPAFFVVRASFSVSNTLGNQYVNDNVESVGRATVLSATGMVYSLVLVPFELAGGVLADAFSPRLTLAAFGGILVVGALAMRAWTTPVSAPRPTDESLD